MEGEIVLAIDNSLEHLCIAISVGEEILEERRIKGRESPSQIIGEEVMQILEKRRLEIKDLSLLISTKGPGSFTGIRVALAFLKGIRAGLGIGLVGVPTLDCLAYPFSFLKGFYILPTIDAKKGEIFCALYLAEGLSIRRLTSYEARKPDIVLEMIREPCLIFGSGVKLLADRIEGRHLILHNGLFDHVPMQALIRLGIENAKRKEENVVPLYGRRSEAEIKFDVHLT
jgi:tRNA threonylcarbamoyladenosine biosynthesis protein TsaB